MRFRPEKSLRFTVYTPRSETVRALLALARSGNVELDPHPYANATLEIRQLQPIVTRIERLLHECGRLLPEYQACPLVPRGTLETIATAALEAATTYAKDRHAFGKAIAEFQAIQWMLADSACELEAARWLCFRAATLKEQGQPFTREASISKLFASEAAVRICNRAMQVHGGYGYTREFPVERYLRDVRVTTIYEGTSEIQRLVIARDLLR